MGKPRSLPSRAAATGVTRRRREALPLSLFPSFLLQVFGQTPFYTVDNAQWSLWPEIPHDLVSEILEWQRVWDGGRGSRI